MFIRRFIVVICYYLVIIHCHSWSTEQQAAIAYIDERIAQAEGVLGDFYKNVDLVGDSVSIDKFKEILRQVAQTKVGYFVLTEINTKLTPQGRSKLAVKISQKNPTFSTSTSIVPNTINFAIYPKETLVIPDDQESYGDVRPILCSAPPDVALFHEILHWARYLAGLFDKTWPTSTKDLTGFTILTHEAFCNTPLFNMSLRETYENTADYLHKSYSSSDTCSMAWMA